jgi:outer membrane protein insertion porin family
MKKNMLRLSIWFFFTSLVLHAEIIERIQIEGNKKVSKDTIQFYMKSKEEGPYIEDKIKDDFKALWETGFFENITIEAENGKSGKIVTIKVNENPLISSVTYKIKRKIKESDITQKLQENNVSLLAFSYYSPSKIKKIEKIIKGILLEKSYNEGKVNVEEKNDRGQIALTIHVDPGPKTKIGKIDFPGISSKHLTSSFLRRGLKNNQPHAFLSMVMNKDVYNKEKIDEDVEEVRLRLQQKGYIEAKVGTPEFSMEKKLTVFGRAQNMMKITIPVELGPRYRLGNVTIEGNKTIKTEFLRTFIKLKKGGIYNVKKRNKAIEEMQKFYGSLGFFYCQVVPTENLDPVKQTADLTLRVQENEIVYLGKLEFKGNTFTKDHVIRREWFLREGRRLNMNALEDSIRRMKQLGLVTIDKMPEIKPDPQDPQKINVTAEVKEMNRQMINFNVGYSGYQGWFIGAGYSTQNFLGMGETFALNLETGTRAKNYQFAFTEPYLFNLPASFGINVFQTSFNYPELYTRNGKGFSLSTSWRFWKYWGAQFSYGFEYIEVSNVSDYLTSLGSYYAYYYAEGKRALSSLTPTLYYSTVDSPIFPSSGTKYLASYRYSGGFLKGDIYMHKLTLEFVKFQPLWSRHVLGFHLIYEGMKPFGGKQIPFYERFFLGGERSIRGFDIYEIGPRNASGQIFGGTKSLMMNVEYAIPIAQQVSFIFFYDIGNSYDSGVPIRINDVYTSTGVELKVFMPVLSVPFRLIFAYNPRLVAPGDQHFAFRFAVGPSFN